MTTGLKKVALANTRPAHPSLSHSLHSRGQDGPHGSVLRRDAAPVPARWARAWPAGGCGSLQAGPRLPLHGLGAGARRERRYSAPPPGEVKAFFSWCRRMDYVDENPFMRVPMVRREQKVVQPFSKDDRTTLLAACNPQTYVGSRMRAMILFLLDTGVRSSELVSIELCDVFFDEGRVRVLQGKGRKQRWTAISEVALAALRTYLDDFRGWGEGHLFQTVDGRALRNHHMNVMFTRHGVRAGVRQVNPHRFRHTFATWAIRVNARELDVQYLLGHSSPMMVRRYSATYDSEQAAAAHAAFSPAMQL